MHVRPAWAPATLYTRASRPACSEVPHLGQGLFSGPKMKGDRKKFRWKERKFKQRQDKRKPVASSSTTP